VPAGSATPSCPGDSWTHLGRTATAKSSGAAKPGRTHPHPVAVDVRRASRHPLRGERAHPPARLARRPEVYAGGRAGCCEPLRGGSAPRAVLAPGPADRVPRVEPGADALPVAVPQLPPRRRAEERPPDHPPHHRGPAEVEPHDRVGAGPEVLDRLGVAAVVGDPAIPGREIAQLGGERRPRRPARSVAQGVDLDEGQIEQTPDAPRERGLARPANARDDDPLQCPGS
jgi:hypothetical protein